MTRAVNDATLQKAGDIYQYLIALRDCFELNDGDTLQIETNGDVKRMSINNIKKLSMNPHFYSLLMQSFLSGYEKPCEIKLPFMAIPILLYAESREKLVNANRRSRIDTLFQSPQIIDERKISGKTRLSGYVDRYNSLKPYCKEAIIILSSEGKIAFNNHKIVLIKKIDYKDFEGAIKDWIKCAFYLGVVFSKTTEDHLSFFLGVDTK